MKLGVIGAGSWGTSLAIAAGRAGSDIVLWSRSSDVTNDINNNQLNSKYLGNISIHQNVKATCDIKDIAGCDAILLVIPAQGLRVFLSLLLESKSGAIINSAIPLVICAKGVEQDSLSLMSDVVSKYFPENPIAILSGPNFADEIAKGLPACATIACADASAADKIIQMMGSKFFRLYYSDDVIGAQIGGSVKNILAIACGIAIGKGLGENARAALVTRGIAEIGRLCVKMGGKQETLLGLSGIGDIMLTCGSEKSRNMSLGIAIGKGVSLSEILENGKTVEGVKTSQSVAMLAHKLGVDMPITCAVKSILHDNADIDKAVHMLLERPFSAEGA
jgi:glycerol-3-phosphate dehydrogenase (NAD(P)+)